MSGIIRLATAQDAAQVCAIYAPSVLHTPISFELEPPTESQMSERITETLTQMPWLVCEEAGEVLGYVYASPHRARLAYRWSVDVAVYVREQRRRGGVGRALYTSLLNLLPLQGYYNAYAGITLPNAASVGLHESVGFEPVGVYRAVGYKLERWHDVGWWQLSLKDRAEEDAPPTEPVPLSAVQETEKWQTTLKTGLPFLR